MSNQARNVAEDSTPSYASAINAGPAMDTPPPSAITSPVIAVTPQRAMQEPPPPLASGLLATLELDSDTIDIYDRSNDSFQYSLKGTVELHWTGDKELLLKEARIDFLGYADTAVLRYESGLCNKDNADRADNTDQNSCYHRHENKYLDHQHTSLTASTTETPVHHTHDFIPTPFVLAPATPSNSTTVPTKHHESLAIDITLPGHLPDSTHTSIGKIRYELQVTLELTFAAGTKAAMTESIILRKPVIVHRIVYPSAYLQPRVALGLDSGEVEIQVKVPRLLHCENTLLAVEISAKPRAPNVKLKKAKVVFEQIETDRYQRTSSSPINAVPKAVALSAEGSNNSGSSSKYQQQQQQASSGLPPLPRLLTQRISRPLEVLFREPTADMETQCLNLQLVLSPAMCVDVQSSWLSISHSLRVEIEYLTDDDIDGDETAVGTVNSTNVGATLVLSQDQQTPNAKKHPTLLESKENGLDLSATELDHLEEERDYRDDSDVLQDYADIEHGDLLDENGIPKYVPVDEKRPIEEGEIGGSSVAQLPPSSLPPPPPPPPPPLLLPAPHNNHHHQASDSDPVSNSDPALANAHHHQHHSSHPSTAHSVGSSTSVVQYSVATEEIPIRVVRVVATGLVDATTIAQAAGETEAGLPTYESVIEATGLPAYAEEKLEDDHEEAEASGTATGVLGGAARRLEGDDA
ncbi:hypothetical protein BG004_007830 [Podila humilis]|nr:hypothetical protein BG004_007830 [Podila humilis]